MLGSTGISSNKGQRNISLCQTIQLPLRLLRSLTQTLHGKIIPLQINPRLHLETIQQMCQKQFIEILSSQHGISIGSLDFKHSP
mmetsp:Transcript_28699/g.42555  ORF Transcript_28699/g.42555 Transcript_28699/m.42555 type:complete len:84 (+) Transcript_28699:2498-2749(+)